MKKEECLYASFIAICILRLIRWIYLSIPVASELLAEIRTRQCRFPTILFWVGKRHCRVLF